MNLLASLSIPILLLALPAAAQSGSITGLGPGFARAFKWTPSGGTVDIGRWQPGPGWSSRANAVFADGNFAAGQSASPQRAIGWNLTAGTSQYLGSLEHGNAIYGSSTAQGISADGMGNAGYATAVSADGKVVVG
ncbi:MAG: hypothetical protein FJ294_12430 [Planctomycetes bacterium]|nr:hypothetical protein [Planctomycetota bacterium]